MMIGSVDLQLPSLSFFRTENYPDVGIYLNYQDDKKRQGHGQIVVCFENLTKDDFFQT